MSYVTTTDYIERYGEEELIQLTDRLGAGVVDAGVFARAAADADAEIDAYLAGRFALPLASVPAVLSRLAADVLRYRLQGDTPLEEARTRYEDARRALEAIASGRISLGVAQATAAVAGGIACAAPGAVFDAAGMSGY